MFVRDCMTPNPTTVGPDASIEEAFGLMRALRVRHLPVLDGPRLVGIVTSTDLVRTNASPTMPISGWELASLWRQATVEDVMTRELLTVSPKVPVELAARTLREHKIGCLPVVEERMLVGIVTESDLFDALTFLLGGDIRGVRMSVALPNGLADLAGLVAALAAVKPEGGAVIINARLDRVSRQGHVRVATTAPLLLAEQLAERGVEVSDLRFEHHARPVIPKRG